MKNTLQFVGKILATCPESGQEAEKDAISV